MLKQKVPLKKHLEEYVEKNLQQMDEKRLKKIHERFDWDEWIEILSPSWSEKATKKKMIRNLNLSLQE